MKKLLATVIVIILLLSVLVLVSKTNKSYRPTSTSKPLFGVSLSPKSFAAGDFNDFMARVKEAGGTLTWSGETQELDKSQSPPSVVTQLAAKYGYTPVILVSSPEKDLLASFAKENKPKYLGIGVEINKKSKEELESFATEFSQTYDAIKSVSPETKVFTVFQLEKMKGLAGGLFGGVNDTTKNQWQLLEKFTRADLIGFTTYPGIIYKDPSQIPSDYYSEIAPHVQKSIAFTEIGWASSTSIKGWESSQDEQAIFIERFFELTKSLNVKMFIWAFMVDQPVIEPFTSMGLIDGNGRPKKAWNTWINRSK